VRSFVDVSKMPLPQQAKIHPFVHTWCTYRAASFTGGQTMAAYNLVQAMRDAATLAVAKYDYVLSPVSPIPAYEAELPSPTNDPKNALPHIAFTVAYNMSEHPASSTNWGYTSDGLPIGVQLVGQRFDDVGVLRLSRALELMRPQQKSWPKPW
jgi:aspartyl-tRNA(Asn)/glutamyl-tRNA(Gln) amidotransferase subunit A